MKDLKLFDALLDKWEELNKLHQRLLESVEIGADDVKRINQGTKDLKQLEKRLCSIGGPAVQIPVQSLRRRLRAFDDLIARMTQSARMQPHAK